MLQRILGGAALAGIGVLLLLKPDAVWKVTERWKSGGATEASPAFHRVTRTLGTVFAVVGLLVLTGILR